MKNLVCSVVEIIEEIYDRYGVKFYVLMVCMITSAALSWNHIIDGSYIKSYIMATLGVMFAIWLFIIIVEEER